MTWLFPYMVTLIMWNNILNKIRIKIIKKTKTRFNLSKLLKLKKKKNKKKKKHAMHFSFSKVNKI